MAAGSKSGMGNRIAPPKFILFVLVLIAGSACGTLLWDWPHAFMIGFDAAASLFLLSCLPLLNDSPAQMRRHAAENDANRVGLLALTVAVTIVVLVTIGVELKQSGHPNGTAIAEIVGTLALAWLFSNVIYALHYAHLYYRKKESGRADSGGIEFPGTKEPDYSGFIYFAFTLGMTFQTSDTDITAARIRAVALFHSFTAFLFNIGVIAFTINALGGK
jgi:uncharacterized membrane protein